jgi:hypothetical protein
MGTSSDYRGGSGGSWTPAKYAATSFAKRGGRDQALRAFGRLVIALGGAASVAASARQARTGAQRLGALYGNVAESGLAAALERAGLEDLVGRSAEEVVDALIDFIGGAGEGRDDQAARDAACDVFEELDEVESIEDLERDLLAFGSVEEILGRFLGAYIYRLLLPVIDERLERLDDNDLKAARDREARQTVQEMVRLRVEERDLSAVAWTGEAANDLVGDLLADCLAALEDLAE